MATKLPFPPLVWTMSPSELKARGEEIIQQTKDVYARVASVTEPTFENCVRPLVTAPNFKSNHLLMSCKFPADVHPDGEMREAAMDIKSKLKIFRVECAARDDVYAVVKKFSSTPEYRNLSQNHKYLVDSILRDFGRGGLSLSPEDKEKFMDALKKDSELCVQYGSNMAESKTELLFTATQLEGMNESFLTSLENRDGKFVVTLAYPHLFGILSRCAVEETRKALLVAYESKCPENVDLLREAIHLRHEASRLAGYKNYAEYALEPRMAESPDSVFSFLNDLKDKLESAAKNDLSQLLALKNAFKSSRGEVSDGKVNAWDIRYYHAMYVQQNYGLDQDMVKPYFPLDKVVSGTLDIYQELLGLKFTRMHGFEAWHDDVSLYAVQNASDNAMMGHFYLDIHPRPGKYGHAAVFSLLKRAEQDGVTQYPVSSMVTNLTKPTDSEPSLLTHDEVVTFFHEFGHVMHGLCAEGEYNMIKFSKTPRDFVEAPSQMLENWCYDPDVLRRISGHHETGEPLPDDFRRVLVEAKNVHQSLFLRRQIWMSLFDMMIHTNPEDDLQALVNKTRKEISLVDNPEKCNFAATFGHIMGGYQAGYYGYLFSQVLSADMFMSRFHKEGVFNTKTGWDYRQEILAPGGFRDGNEMVARFLGRPHNSDNFLKSIGLSPA